MILALLPWAKMRRGLEQYARTKGAMLIDVRERAEYAQGHIPDSVNLPLDACSDAAQVRALIPDPKTALFLYCLTGRRAQSARAALQRLGYRNCQVIGGTSFYRGDLVQ